VKHTDETKRKMSEMRRGERNPFFGHKHTPEVRAKLIGMLSRARASRQFLPREQRVRIPTGVQLGYLAAMIDGEGSLKFGRGRPFVAVYNTDERVMRWLVETVGGSAGPWDKRGRVPCWTWHIGAARDVLAVVEAVRPFLICKATEADVAIKYLRSKYG